MLVLNWISTVKKRSQKQEKLVAKSFNAKLTPASGALWGAKGDVRNDKFLIECKTTEKDFYILTAKVWEKIHEEAVKDHLRIPLMVIDLEDRERYVVFRPMDLNCNMITPLLSEVKVQKSIKIYKGIVGKMSTGDYVSAQQFIIRQRQNNVLCVMLYKDFEEQFKEELKC